MASAGVGRCSGWEWAAAGSIRGIQLASEGSCDCLGIGSLALGQHARGQLAAAERPTPRCLHVRPTMHLRLPKPKGHDKPRKRPPIVSTADAPPCGM